MDSRQRRKKQRDKQAHVDAARIPALEHQLERAHDDFARVAKERDEAHQQRMAVSRENATSGNTIHMLEEQLESERARAKERATEIRTLQAKLDEVIARADDNQAKVDAHDGVVNERDRLRRRLDAKARAVAEAPKNRKALSFRGGSW